MTEAEWFEKSVPEPLLEFVRGKASERKLRLFACACCRQIWRLLGSDEARDVVTASEDFADDAVSEADLSRICRNIVLGCQRIPPYTARRYAAEAAGHTAGASAWAAAWNVVATVRQALDQHLRRAPYLETAHQAHLIRDIVGNPFQRTRIDSLRLEWNNQAILNIAELIYRDRRFADMPILGDALEEAGCRDEKLLRHCRSDLEHVRGCWVVDQILNLG